MTTTRKRRIVRRVVLSAAVPLMLLVWYVLAWLTASRAERDHYITPGTATRIRVAFVPLLNYCESGLPGSRALGTIWWSVNPPVIISGFGIDNPVSHGFGELGASTKIWIHPTLSPPRTAEIEEMFQREFPQSGTLAQQFRRLRSKSR